MHSTPENMEAPGGVPGNAPGGGCAGEKSAVRAAPTVE